MQNQNKEDVENLKFKIKEFQLNEQKLKQTLKLSNQKLFNLDQEASIYSGYSLF